MDLCAYEQSEREKRKGGGEEMGERRVEGGGRGSRFTPLKLLILIKFSSIPVVILTIYLFFKNYKFLIKEVFHFNYIIIYILCIMFFAQQFIYTGCFIFPSNLSCFDVSWFDQNFLNSKHKLES